MALLMMFLLGGAAGTTGSGLTEPMLDAFAARSRAAITDPARADEVAGEVEAMRSELKQFVKVYGRSSKTLTKLYRDHRSDAAAMKAELDALESSWEVAQARALDYRFAVREKMTREEWDRVFGAGSD